MNFRKKYKTRLAQFKLDLGKKIKPLISRSSFKGILLIRSAVGVNSRGQLPYKLRNNRSLSKFGYWELIDDSEYYLS